MLRKIKVRCNTQENMKLQELGVNTDDKYVLKQITVNTSLIAFYEDYDGMLCIAFGGNIDQFLITDLEYSEANIAWLHV